MSHFGLPLCRGQRPTSKYPEEGDPDDKVLNNKSYEEQEAFNLAKRSLGQL